MIVGRDINELNGVTLDIFRCKFFSAQFKVRTSYQILSATGSREASYYNEYIYNVKNNKKTTINLSPQSYIQFTIRDESNEKNILYLSEYSKNKFLRKVIPIIKLLEAYDDGVDIIGLSSTGDTYISTSKVPGSNNKISFLAGKTNVYISVIITEEGTVGVNMSFDESDSVVLRTIDFLNLCYKLKTIEYVPLSLTMITFLGTPNPGTNKKDFRKDPMIFDEEELTPPIQPKKDSDIQSLQSLGEVAPLVRTGNNPVNW